MDKTLLELKKLKEKQAGQNKQLDKIIKKTTDNILFSLVTVKELIRYLDFPDTQQMILDLDSAGTEIDLLKAFYEIKG